MNPEENEVAASPEPTPSAEEMRFPAFTAGDADTALRHVRAEAPVWSAQYARTGGFPEPELVPVPSGSLIFLSGISDLRPSRRGFRLYLTEALLSAVQEALDWQGSEQVATAFENSVADSCWGSLALATGHHGPDSVNSVRARLTTILRCWDSLAKLNYVDAVAGPVSLDEVVLSHFAGLVQMWLKRPSGDARQDVKAALAALEAADPETRLSRAVERLAQLAADNDRIRHRETLTDPDFLRRELEELDPQQLEAVETGSSVSVLTVLYGADRYLDTESD